jgi:predicted nucleotidyltransferase
MGTPAVIPITDAVLAEIVSRLVACFQPERIYLFGSRARGDMGPDSDYDLLMVLDRLDEPAYRLAQRAHSLLWGLGTAADILVWSRQAFDSRLSLRASLPSTVVREGVLLHGG